jgi:hypothetical protein
LVKGGAILTSTALAMLTITTLLLRLPLAAIS